MSIPAAAFVLRTTSEPKEADALLIYTDERQNGASEEEQEKMMGEYFAYTEGIRSSGHMLGGEALHPVAAATTVQVRDGKTLVTDGPFAETKEKLGGFYLVEAKDADEAIELAARIPDSRNGKIEVRPIVEFES
jgi:hypothetical protein